MSSHAQRVTHGFVQLRRVARTWWDRQDRPSRKSGLTHHQVYLELLRCMHLDAAQSASGCIAHLDAGPFSGIFLHWHLDASLPCGIGIEMQALFLASLCSRLPPPPCVNPEKNRPKLTPSFFCPFLHPPDGKVVFLLVYVIHSTIHCSYFCSV